MHKINGKLLQRITAAALVYTMVGTQVLPAAASTGSVPEADYAEDTDDTIRLSGNIVFMGDGCGELFEPNLMLYIDGEPAKDKNIYISKDGSLAESDELYFDTDVIPIINDLEIPKEDAEVAGAPVVTWHYWTDALPEEDEEGNSYEYSIRAIDADKATASNATSSNATDSNAAANTKGSRMPKEWELFYLDEDGQVIGDDSTWTSDAHHLTYVKKGIITGTYEQEHTAAVLPERIPLMLDTVSGDDLDYIDLATGWIDTGAGSWTITDALMYNPQTGEPMEWRAQAASGVAYSFIYQNEDEYETEEEHIYTGGTIVSTDNVYSVTGVITWDDADNWHGKRPVDASFIKVKKEDGTDVTSSLEIEILSKGNHTYKYQVDGLIVGEEYALSTADVYYKEEVVAIPEGEKDETVSAEKITMKLCTSRYYGSIIWQSDSKVIKRPTSLDFLHIYDNDKEVTNHAQIKMVGASADDKTWYYAIDGLVTGAAYQMQVEAPMGYTSEIKTCSIGYCDLRSLQRTVVTNQIIPIPLNGSEEVKQALVAIIQVDPNAEKTGTAVAFDLHSTFSTPVGAEDGQVYPFVVNIDGDLEYFDFLGQGVEVQAGDADADLFVGWQRIQIAVNEGQGNKFIYYNKAKNQISYTLEAGETLDTTIRFSTKNGVTKDGATLSLDPTVEAAIPENWKTNFVPGERSVTADFKWNAVDKASTTQTLGDILTNKGFSNVTYTIVANNAQSGERTGVIFTDEYTITDTLTLTNMYIDLSSGATLTQGTTEADKNKLFLTEGSNTYPVLAINGDYNAYADIKITPKAEGGKVKEIVITYTLKRTDHTKIDNGDIVNLALEAVFYFGSLMKNENAANYFVAETGVKDIYAIANNVNFEAKSYFYDKQQPADSDYNKNHYASSSDKVTIYGRGKSFLEKVGYSSSEDIKPYDPTNEATLGTTEQLDAKHGNYMYYTINYRNTGAAMSEVYISDFLVNHTDKTNQQYFDLATMEVQSMTVNGIPVADQTWDNYYDPATEYKAKQCAELSALIKKDYSASHENFTYVQMYKKFENVKVGDEIQIIYRIKLLSAEATDAIINPVYGYNAAIAATKAPSDGVIDTTAVLDYDFTRLFVNPSSDKFYLSKYAYDPTPGNGWPQIKDIKTGGEIVFGVYAKNPSKTNSASFARLIENWPFDGITLTNIDVSYVDKDNNKIDSKRSEMIENLIISFYQIDETSGGDKPDEGGIVDDKLLGSWNNGIGTIGAQSASIGMKEYLVELAKLNPQPDYIEITHKDKDNGMITVDPDHQLKFFFYGDVYATSDVANNAWLEYRKGEGEEAGESSPKVEIAVSALSVTTEKKAYKVSAEDYRKTVAAATNGDFRAVSELGEEEALYMLGDYVRYEITVTNQSLNENLKWIYVADEIPKIFSIKRELPVAIYYEDFDAGHKVIELLENNNKYDWGLYHIPEYGQILEKGTYTPGSSTNNVYTDGQFSDGKTKQYEYMKETGYRGGIGGNASGGTWGGDVALYLQAFEDTNGDPLVLGSKQSVKFHVYYEITENVVETSQSQKSYGLSTFYNDILSIGGNKIGDTTSSAYDQAHVMINVVKDDNERFIEVNKVAYGVVKPEANLKFEDIEGFQRKAIVAGDPTKVLLEKAGNKLSAAKDDYIIYQLRLTDRTSFAASKAGQKISVYGFWDKIPEGTEFVGFSSLRHTFPAAHADNLLYPEGYKSNGAIWDYCCVGYNQGDYHETNRWTALLLADSVEYDEQTRIASLNLTKGFEFDPSATVNMFVIVKVTDSEKVEFNNVGGFITNLADVKNNGDIQTKNYNDSGLQLTTDDATVAGPTYYPGINKVATEFSADGETWLPYGNDGIDPAYYVRWEIELQNDPQNGSSTSDIKKYTLTDVLPKGMTFHKAYLETENGQIDLPLDTIVDEANGKKVSWVIDTAQSGFEHAAIPNGKSIKLIVLSKWGGGAPTYGNYTNRAYLELDAEYPFNTAIAGKKVENNPQAIYSEDVVNMMGNYSTTSYKTIKNITAASPYENEFATAYNYPEDSVLKVPTEKDYIRAVVGDTVEYTLTVKNNGKQAAGNISIIDVLPHIGDSGVVNTSQPRESKFNVSLADSLNLKVVLMEADGETETTISAADYDVSYTTFEGETSLNMTDWEGGNGIKTWTASQQPDSNTIRINFKSDYAISVGQTIKVTFAAKVPSALYEEQLPKLDEIAWNSFGYCYSSGGPTIHAEPVQVGVTVPYSTIDVSKKLLDIEGIAVNNSTKEFTFLLEYSKTGTDGSWVPAEKISYSIDGEALVDDKVPVHVTDSDGKFKLLAGGKLRLYVPAGDYYRITEVNIPGGYQLMSDDFEMTAQAQESENYSVEFVNQITDGALLPETGGIGTLPFTVGGLGIMLFSFLSYTYFGRRRKRIRV